MDTIPVITLSVCNDVYSIQLKSDMGKITDQQKKIEEDIRILEAMGGSLTGTVKNVRDSTFKRFPFIFVFLSTFGLVATFYGFEKVIDQIDFFSDNPHMVLIAGVATLVLTGSLYKKLS